MKNEGEKEIQHHTEAILHLVEKMLGQGRQSGPLFLNIPLFLAGAVTSSSGARITALELLSNLAETEIGYDTAATSSMLQIVCETQLQHSRGKGHAHEVDWMEVGTNHGFRLVSYG